MTSCYQNYRDAAAKWGVLEPKDVAVWKRSLLVKDLPPPPPTPPTPRRKLERPPASLPAESSDTELEAGAVRRDDLEVIYDTATDDDTDSEVESEYEEVEKPAPAQVSHYLRFEDDDPDAQPEGDAELHHQFSVSSEWHSSLGAGEPPYTHVVPRIERTCDYIWFTPGVLSVSAVLSMPNRARVEGFLPSRKLSSPHLCIMAELKFEPSVLSADWSLT